MKKGFKIISLIVVVLAVMICLISESINLVLNKKYVVDQIKYTERKQGLEGIQEIITADYIEIIRLNLFIILILIGFTGIIIFQIVKINKMRNRNNEKGSC